MKTNKAGKFKRPLYINVYDELLLQISKGKYPVGSRLPSEHDLASSLGISRVTLRQALSLLQDDGLVRNERGKGHFVIDSFYKHESVQLEKIGNPMHKCHLSTFDQINIHYRLDSETKYTKQVLKSEASTVVAIERLYRKDNNLVAYAFTFISMESVEKYGIDLNDNEQMLNFFEHQVYKNTNRGEIEIKYTHTVNLADKKEKLVGQNECFLLLENLYDNKDTPLLINKFYIPQQFAKIKLNVFE